MFKQAFVIFMALGTGKVAANCEIDGYYFKTGASQILGCPGYVECEPGFYCTNLEKFPCEEGYFSSQSGEYECDNICPKGYYCPLGTAEPMACQRSNEYCPEGSTTPLKVPKGYYSIGTNARFEIQKCPRGYYCINGVREICKDGYFGDQKGLSENTCSGRCPEGFVCPPGTTDQYANSCANKPWIYCPYGSMEPTFVEKGYYSVLRVSEGNHSMIMAGAYAQRKCEPGYYCPYDFELKHSMGVKIECPGGRYGDVAMEINAECSGVCDEGYYCPPASTNARQAECEPNTFCSRGAKAHTGVQRGYFVTDGDSKGAMQEIICPEGSYCIQGVRHRCPKGTYGNQRGLFTPDCSGICKRGYYCKVGSTTPTQYPCGGASFYCPPGSHEPTLVSNGYFTIGEYTQGFQTQSELDVQFRNSQRICPPGSYCLGGAIYECPGGRFGNETGLNSSTCSGNCTKGYYCPPQSSSAEQIPCGSSEYYCPEGSPQPIQASRGYCTSGDSRITKFAQHIAPIGHYARFGVCIKCPPGRYGDQEGLAEATCSGVCLPGYYCPMGSIHNRQVPCGSPDLYCPKYGADRPVKVLSGYYTTIHGTSDCPAGKYRQSRSTVALPAIMQNRNPFPINYGTLFFPYADCAFCPEGTFKALEGDSSTDCQLCPIHTSHSTDDRTACQCYRLSFGDTYNTSTHYLDFDGVHCVAVEKSYRNANGINTTAAISTRTTRTMQKQCEPGYYCLAGIRYICPSGYYGSKPRETSALCTGTCYAGYYCPSGSTKPTQVPCGHRDLFCPAASEYPIPVLPGYYSSNMENAIENAFDSDESIRLSQRQCEPGHYCQNAKKYICPSGTFGDQYGETSGQCAGPCLRGHFCPEGSTSNTERTCGSIATDNEDNYYCPSGASTPTEVTPGYFSEGYSNSTRFFQTICEIGYFCVNGIQYQCPEGYYGADKGLSSPLCSGICSKGYRCPSPPGTPSISSTALNCGNNTVYCPEGTSDEPILVRAGYYSTGGTKETRTGESICEKGYYCQGGVKRPCDTGRFGNQTGLVFSDCTDWCEAGYACPLGSTSAHQIRCEVGYYSNKGALSCTQCPDGPTSPTQCTHSRSCCFQ